MFTIDIWFLVFKIKHNIQSNHLIRKGRRILLLGLSVSWVKCYFCFIKWQRTIKNNGWMVSTFISPSKSNLPFYCMHKWVDFPMKEFGMKKKKRIELFSYWVSVARVFFQFPQVQKLHGNNPCWVILSLSLSPFFPPSFLPLSFFFSFVKGRKLSSK